MKSSHTFVDEARIEVASGDGGDGLVAFRREKFVPQGGPFGGDGGRGGDVVLIADRNKSTLSEFHYRQKFRAQSGQRGGGSGKTGASGETLEIHLPVGTVVYGRAIEPADDDGAAPEWEADTAIELGAEEAAHEDEHEGEEVQLVDLTEDGQRFVVARGGKGGLGNMRFKSSTRQTPDFALPGLPGQRLKLRLSLKLLADVGLVGFPNAGKSTLLRRLSAAKPKVASYPFTTLTPSLGVVELGERRFVVADIPGLIEGASEGAGLGHQFLRHVERTRVLVHLLDVGAMLLEGRDLLSDYEAIRRELRRYRPELLERREIVVLNKVDLLQDDAPIADLVAKLRERGIEPLRLSGATGEGREALVRAMLKALDEALADELELEQSAARGAEGDGSRAGGRRARREERKS